MAAAWVQWLLGVALVGALAGLGWQVRARRRAERQTAFDLDVIAACPDAVLVLDPHDAAEPMRIIDCNEQVCRLHGYAREELLGRSVNMLEADPWMWTRERALASMDVLRRVGVRRGEALHRRRDGSQFLIEFSNSIVRLHGREVMLGFDRDISVRKQAEAALRASEERFQAIFEHSPTGIQLMDPNDEAVPMRIVQANRKAAEMHGVAPERMVGRSIGDFEPAPVTREQSLEKVRRLRDTRVMSGEAMHRRADGSLFPIEYQCTLIELDGREFVLGIDRDITERRRLDAEINESRRLRAVGAMVGGVAHEFNNLLTPMKLYAEMLSRPDVWPDAPKVAPKPLAQAVQQAQELTRRILAFGRRGNGERERCDLVVAVRDAVALLAQTIDRRIRVDMQLTPEAPVRLRRTDLNQIILNLLINARDTLVEKADGGEAPAGWTPTLTVSIGRHESSDPRVRSSAGTATPFAAGWWRLTVSDNGLGMSDEARERAFEPFFTTKPTGRGTGLGLATVWHVVSTERGHVNLDTRRGEGTRIDIFLPAATPEAAALAPVAASSSATPKTEAKPAAAAASAPVPAPAQAPAPTPGTTPASAPLPALDSSTAPASKSATTSAAAAFLPELEPLDDPKAAGPRVLFVEDQSFVAEPVSRLLEMHGFRVHHVEDGGAAHELLKRDPAAWDAILSDLNLPGMKGCELVGRARELGFRGRIVAYSGMVSAESRVQLERAKVQAILHKPFDIADLVRALK